MNSYQGTFKLDGVVQNVTYAASSVAMTNAFGNGVTRARIVATSDCWVTQGKTPTASTSGVFLPASKVEYITVMPGEKLAAIQNSAGGVLNVTEAP